MKILVLNLNLLTVRLTKLEVIYLKYFRNMFTITFANITSLIELFKYGTVTVLIVLKTV